MTAHRSRRSSRRTSPTGITPTTIRLRAATRSWPAGWANDGSPDESSRDQPGTYEASYRAVAVDGSVAVATGSTRYRDQPDGPITRIFDNCFVIRFDHDGRCVDFVEWFIERPATGGSR